MTVGELIECLKTFPPGARATIWSVSEQYWLDEIMFDHFEGHRGGEVRLFTHQYEQSQGLATITPVGRPGIRAKIDPEATWDELTNAGRRSTPHK